MGCFFKWANLSLFFNLSSFLINSTNFTTNKCEKCPSGIRHWDSNSQPSDYESHPLTTRPGLPPTIITVYSEIFLTGLGNFKYRLRLFTFRQGRINYGPDAKDFKGIVSNVTLNGIILTNWNISGLPLDNGQAVEEFAKSMAGDSNRRVIRNKF